MFYFSKKGFYKRQNECFWNFFCKKSFGNILGTFFKRVDYTKIEIKVKRWQYTFASGKSLNPAPQTKKKKHLHERHSSPHLNNHVIIIPETKTLRLMKCFSRLKVRWKRYKYTSKKQTGMLVNCSPYLGAEPAF